MARAGDTLTNPVTGHRYEILQSAADTRGALLDMRVTFAAGVAEPPLHVHPVQEEEFEVLAGTLTVRLGDVPREVRAGERFVVPRGLPHAMWNASPDETVVRWQTRPALRTEHFFEALTELARTGRTNADGVPDLLDLALLLTTYRDEMRLVRPPALVQRLLFGALRPLAMRRRRRQAAAAR